MEQIPEINVYFILLTFAVSFAACFFSSLSGGGAGLILLPVLLFTGLPFINALASHKLAVGFIGIGSTTRYAQEKLIDWKVFWWTAIIGLPFVVFGTRFAASIPEEIMKPLVGGVILGMVAVSLLKKQISKKFDPKKLSKKVLLIGTLLFVPAAFYSGWISAGSGVFTTFIYLWLLKYDQLHATAMTLAANGIFWNGVGAAAHIFMGHVVWSLAPGLILGAILGSYYGASVGIKKGNKFLRFMFLGTAGITGTLLLLPTILKYIAGTA
ncbi:MAG: sulfite exporter TauE/SafE family protein [Thiomargarita sp.]|nr:sulfite exporter TauE/SafE family protein [Thiomargarita sp.]